MYFPRIVFIPPVFADKDKLEILSDLAPILMGFDFHSNDAGDFNWEVANVMHEQLYFGFSTRGKHAWQGIKLQ